MLSVVLFVVSLMLIGFIALRTTVRLNEAYGRTSKFWWLAYLPGLGFGLILMAAGGPLGAMIPGVIVIAASLWLVPKSGKPVR